MGRPDNAKSLVEEVALCWRSDHARIPGAEEGMAISGPLQGRRNASPCTANPFRSV